MLFGTLIKAARARERDAGVDYTELACYAAKLTPYVQSHITQTISGLETLYIRMPPAPLDEERQRERWEDYREEFVHGIRETLDHLAKALAAVGCTESELEAMDSADEADENPDDPSDENPVSADSESEETVVLPVPQTGEGEEESEPEK